jgi:surface antigen
MTDKTEYSCSASVTFTIRVEGKGTWGKEATVEEVMRNGGRETIEAINAALFKSGLRYTMVKDPEVGAIMWARKI